MVGLQVLDVTRIMHQNMLLANEKSNSFLESLFSENFEFF